MQNSEPHPQSPPLLPPVPAPYSPGHYDPNNPYSPYSTSYQQQAPNPFPVPPALYSSNVPCPPLPGAHSGFSNYGTASGVYLPPPPLRDYDKIHSGTYYVPPSWEDENESVTNSSRIEKMFPGISEWRDLISMIAFLVHLIGVGIVLGIFHTPPEKEVAYAPRSNRTRGHNTTNHDNHELHLNFDSLLVLVCFAAGIAYLYLQVIKKHPQALIYSGFFVTVASMTLLTFYCFSAGLTIYGAFFMFLTVFLPFYYYTMRSRIPFAIAILKAAIRIITQFPATQIAPFCSILVHLIWSSFWLYTLSLVIPHLGESSGATAGLIYLIFSFYWVHEVITNVLHMTICGVVGSWYFLSGTPQMPSSPTLGALKRAVTTSFGSVCLGSLFVAVLRTIRATINILSDYNEFTSCILDCLDGLISYFNHYAFCQVAIYGKTFCTAAVDTWSLLKRSGIEAIANDNILSGVFLLGSFFGAAVVGFIGYLLEVWPGNNDLALFFSGCIVGYVVVGLVMQVLDSAVVCIFVCFAEAPDALKHHDLDLWEKLWTYDKK